MKIVSKQNGLANKHSRQRYLLNNYPEKFYVDCEGACAHVGSVRKGCGECLSTNVFCQYIEIGDSLNIKNVCSGTCPYCFSTDEKKNKGNSVSSEIIENGLLNISREFTNPLSVWDPMNVFMSASERGLDKFKYITYNITGSGSEPSLYMPILEVIFDYYNKIFHPQVKEITEEAPTVKLYSNGYNLTERNIDKLAELGVTELRINVAALKFSEEIYRKVEYAAKRIPLVTFEVAVYPPYKNKLFEMVDIAEQVGVKHISWCQLKVYEKAVFEKLKNFEDLKNYSWYPAINNIMVMDDNGLVEELIEKTIINNYSQSIIDCNAVTLASQGHNNNIFKDINNDFDRIVERAKE